MARHIEGISDIAVNICEKMEIINQCPGTRHKAQGTRHKVVFEGWYNDIEGIV